MVPQSASSSTEFQLKFEVDFSGQRKTKEHSHMTPVLGIKPGCTGETEASALTATPSVFRLFLYYFIVSMVTVSQSY